MEKEKISIYPAILAFIFLTLAILGGFDYSFYMLLRLIITLVSVYYSYKLIDSKYENLKIALFVNAIIFNPFLPLSLGRDIWVIFDMLNVGLFIYVLKARKTIYNEKNKK